MGDGAQLTRDLAQLTASTFKDSLAKVLKKKGIVLQEFWVESRLVSLYDLYQKVMISGGGGEKVRTVPSSSPSSR